MTIFDNSFLKPSIGNGVARHKFHDSQLMPDMEFLHNDIEYGKAEDVDFMYMMVDQGQGDENKDEVHVHRALGPHGLIGMEVYDMSCRYYNHESRDSDSKDLEYGYMGIGAKTKKSHFSHQMTITCGVESVPRTEKVDPGKPRILTLFHEDLSDPNDFDNVMLCFEFRSSSSTTSPVLKPRPDLSRPTREDEEVSEAEHQALFKRFRDGFDGHDSKGRKKRYAGMISRLRELWSRLSQTQPPLDLDLLQDFHHDSASLQDLIRYLPFLLPFLQEGRLGMVNIWYDRHKPMLKYVSGKGKAEYGGHFIRASSLEEEKKMGPGYSLNSSLALMFEQKPKLKLRLGQSPSLMAPIRFLDKHSVTQCMLSLKPFINHLKPFLSPNVAKYSLPYKTELPQSRGLKPLVLEVDVMHYTKELESVLGCNTRRVNFVYANSILNLASLQQWLAFQKTEATLASGTQKGQKLCFVISVKGDDMFSQNKEQLQDWARIDLDKLLTDKKHGSFGQFLRELVACLHFVQFPTQTPPVRLQGIKESVGYEFFRDWLIEVLASDREALKKKLSALGAPVPERKGKDMSALSQALMEARENQAANNMRNKGKGSAGDDSEEFLDEEEEQVAGTSRQSNEVTAGVKTPQKGKASGRAQGKTKANSVADSDESDANRSQSSLYTGRAARNTKTNKTPTSPAPPANVPNSTSPSSRIVTNGTVDPSPSLGILKGNKKQLKAQSGPPANPLPSLPPPPPKPPKPTLPKVQAALEQAHKKANKVQDSLQKAINKFANDYHDLRFGPDAKKKDPEALLKRVNTLVKALCRETDQTIGANRIGGGKNQLEFGKEHVNKQVEVYWENMGQSYKGVVMQYNELTRHHQILYEDEEVHWENLNEEVVQLLDDNTTGDESEHAEELENNKEGKGNMEDAEMEDENLPAIKCPQPSTKSVQMSQKTKSSTVAGKTKHPTPQSQVLNMKSKPKQGKKDVHTAAAPTPKGNSQVPRKGAEGGKADTELGGKRKRTSGTSKDLHPPSPSSSPPLATPPSPNNSKKKKISQELHTLSPEQELSALFSPEPRRSSRGKGQVETPTLDPQQEEREQISFGLQSSDSKNEAGGVNSGSELRPLEGTTTSLPATKTPVAPCDVTPHQDCHVIDLSGDTPGATWNVATTASTSQQGIRAECSSGEDVAGEMVTAQVCLECSERTTNSDKTNPKFMLLCNRIGCEYQDTYGMHIGCLKPNAPAEWFCEFCTGMFPELLAI